jgi:uncharacterized protein
MDSTELSRAARLAAAPFPIFQPRAPWWGGDLQTLRNFFVGSRARLAAYAGSRLLLPVGDGSGDRLAAALSLPPAFTRHPLALLVHGLTGSEQSFYMHNTAAHLLGLGFPVLRLNLRGAGASRPFCRLQYHAGRSEDLAAALAALPPALTAAGVVAIGYSLGANMLLKFLGERGGGAPLKAAAAVSAPLDLAACSRQMLRRRNLPYQRYLLRAMQQEALGEGAELSAPERTAVVEARTIWEFDHASPRRATALPVPRSITSATPRSVFSTASAYRRW